MLTNICLHTNLGTHGLLSDDSGASSVDRGKLDSRDPGQDFLFPKDHQANLDEWKNILVRPWQKGLVLEQVEQSGKCRKLSFCSNAAFKTKKR